MIIRSQKLVSWTNLVAFGEDEQGFSFDTNTMAYEMVPAEFGEYRLLVMTTNKKRTDGIMNDGRNLKKPGVVKRKC